MLTIGEYYGHLKNNQTLSSGKRHIYIYIYTKIIIDDDNVYDLWYSIDKEYKEYLSLERSDAFVVNLLLYAMEHKLDIECEVPLSEKLYYQLTEHLIPSIVANINKYHRINLICDRNSDVLAVSKAVGGSLSGGVDSFYTLLRHIHREDKNFNITHLCFFNAGASGSYGGSQARQKYKNRIDWIKDVAATLQKKLICVDTNVNEFLEQDFQSTCTFRNLAIPLLLQKLFSKYYFASGTSFADFKFSNKDTADYDLLIVQCLSTETLQFYSDGGAVSRIDKINYIANFSITHSRLNVCAREDVNCSKCEKCRRTMMALFILGKLDLYYKVFDINYFNENKSKFMMTASKERNNIEWRDIYVHLRNDGEITLLHHIVYGIRFWIKMLDRMCRGK